MFLLFTVYKAHGALSFTWAGTRHRPGCTEPVHDVSLKCAYCWRMDSRSQVNKRVGYCINQERVKFKNIYIYICNSKKPYRN